MNIINWFGRRTQKESTGKEKFQAWLACCVLLLLTMITFVIVVISGVWLMGFIGQSGLLQALFWWGVFFVCVGVTGAYIIGSTIDNRR